MGIFYNKNSRRGIAVYVLIILSILLIIITGLFSYNKISFSLNNLNNKINQDFELASIKEIRLNYAKLDNMMEMFLITHKSSYIEETDTTAARTRVLIAKLRTSKKISKREHSLVDSLKMLITNKVKNLKYISRFQQDASIERLIKDFENMQSIRSAMDREQRRKRPRTNILLPTEKNQKKQAKAVPETKQLDTVLETRDIFDISDTTSINPYLKKDYNINVSFNTLCALIENIETDRIDLERKQSEKSIKEANQYTLLLGSCIIILLTIASVTYFKYTKKLAEVRKSLSDSKEIAEEMTIIKERFMANMSHEIRTPLNAISGFVDQLHQSNINSKQKKQTEIIQKSIQHILNIVNDILDFSKLNAGKLTLSKSGFEMEPLVKQIIESLDPLVAEKHIHISCHIDDTLPKVLIGDAYRLKQILLNIIGNAIKYTNQQGSIHVTVGYRKTAENWYKVEIGVKDTGIGIEKADLDNIFKEFHMAENARWTKSGSTGLGLSITKMLVELYHGTIEIDSKINEGTHVRIQIPFEAGSDVDLSMADPYLNHLNFIKNKEILIADDEPFNRVLLNNILHKYGAITTDAENGTHVLSLLRNKSFDCILMDIKMPEINGLETSKRIRESKNEEIAHIPIIAVSAAITAENMSFLQSIGVNSFLEKPFKEKDLMNLLYKILGKGQEGSVLQLPKITEQQPLNRSGSFDLSELQRQAGNDQTFIKDMIMTLIESTHKGMQEMETYLEYNEWDKIHLTAHRIASPLKFIFARETYDTIKQLEAETMENAVRDKDNIIDLFDLFKEQFKKLEQLLQEYVENH
jgi:signal transduction histidine kinase/DNA-binding response OmpR family regulator